MGFDPEKKQIKLTPVNKEDVEKKNTIVSESGNGASDAEVSPSKSSGKIKLTPMNSGTPSKGDALLQGVNEQEKVANSIVDKTAESRKRLEAGYTSVLGALEDVMPYTHLQQYAQSKGQTVSQVLGKEVAADDFSKEKELGTVKGLVRYTARKRKQIEEQQKLETAKIANNTTFSSGTALAYEQQAAIAKQQRELNEDAYNVAVDTLRTEGDGKKITKEYVETLGKDMLKIRGDHQIEENDAIVNNLAQKTNQSKEDIQTRETVKYKQFNAGREAMVSALMIGMKNSLVEAKPKIEETAKLLNDFEKSDKEQQKILAESIKLNLESEPVRDYFNSLTKLNDTHAATKNISDNNYKESHREDLRRRLIDASAAITQKLSSRDISKTNRKNLLAKELDYMYHALFGGNHASREELSKATGIPLDEVNSIMDENIKGVLFDRDAVVVPGLTGEFIQGIDGTIASIVQGSKRFLNGDVTGDPFYIGDNAGEDNLVMQTSLDKKAYKSEFQELFDKQGKLNLNMFSILGTIGNTTGQVAVFAAPTLVTGGLAGATVGAETLLASGIEAATTLGTGFLASYESGYQNAAPYTDNEQTRRAVAAWTGFVNGVSELILPDAQLVKRAMGLGSKLGIEAFERAIKQKGVAGAMMEQTAHFLKEIGKQAIPESAEEVFSYLGEYATKKAYLGEEKSWGEIGDDLIQTVVQTSIGTLGLGVGAGINGSKIKKEAIYEAGISPSTYIAKYDALLANGKIDQNEYNEKVKAINIASKIANKISNQATIGKDGKLKPFSYDKRVNLTAEQFRIEYNKINQENSTIDAEREAFEADTEEALNNQREELNRDDAPYYEFDGDEISREEAIKRLDSGNSEGLTIRGDESLQKRLEEQGGMTEEELALDKDLEADTSDLEKLINNSTDSELEASAEELSTLIEAEGVPKEKTFKEQLDNFKAIQEQKRQDAKKDEKFQEILGDNKNPTFKEMFDAFKQADKEVTEQPKESKKEEDVQPKKEEPKPTFKQQLEQFKEQKETEKRYKEALGDNKNPTFKQQLEAFKAAKTKKPVVAEAKKEDVNKKSDEKQVVEADDQKPKPVENNSKNNTEDEKQTETKEAEETELSEEQHESIVKRLMELQKDYNRTQSNHTRKKSGIMRQIVNLSSKVGVQIKSEGSKVTLFNKEGNQLQAKKVDWNAGNEGRVQLENRPEAVKKLLTALKEELLDRAKSNPGGIIGREAWNARLKLDTSMSPDAIVSGLSRILNGKEHNYHSYDLLDMIESWVEVGFVPYVEGKAGLTQRRTGVPIEYYLTKEEDVHEAENNLSEKESNALVENGVTAFDVLNDIPEHLVDFLDDFYQDHREEFQNIDFGSEFMETESDIAAQEFREAMDVVMNQEFIDNLKNKQDANKPTTNEGVKPDAPSGQNQANNGASESSSKKNEEVAKIEDDIKKEAERLKKLIKKSRGQLNSLGFDPEVVESGVKLIALYAKLGIYKFKDVASRLMNDLGERSEELLTLIKKLYLANSIDNDNPLYEERSDIKDLKIDDIPEFKKEEDEESVNKAEVEFKTVDGDKKGVIHSDIFPGVDLVFVKDGLQTVVYEMASGRRIVEGMFSVVEELKNEILRNKQGEKLIEILSNPDLLYTNAEKHGIVNKTPTYLKWKEDKEEQNKNEYENRPFRYSEEMRNSIGKIIEIARAEGFDNLASIFEAAQNMRGDGNTFPIEHFEKGLQNARDEKEKQGYIDKKEPLPERLQEELVPMKDLFDIVSQEFKTPQIPKITKELFEAASKAFDKLRIIQKTYGYAVWKDDEGKSHNPMFPIFWLLSAYNAKVFEQYRVDAAIKTLNTSIEWANEQYDIWITEKGIEPKFVEEGKIEYDEKLVDRVETESRVTAQIRKNIEKKKSEIQTAKENYNKKIKELDKKVDENQIDLFGERKEKPGLFGAQEIDNTAREKALKPLKEKRDKLITELMQLEKQLAESLKQGEQQVDLNLEDTTVTGHFDINQWVDKSATEAAEEYRRAAEKNENDLNDWADAYQAERDSRQMDIIKLKELNDEKAAIWERINKNAENLGNYLKGFDIVMHADEFMEFLADREGTVAEAITALANQEDVLQDQSEENLGNFKDGDTVETLLNSFQNNDLYDLSKLLADHPKDWHNEFRNLMGIPQGASQEQILEILKSKYATLNEDSTNTEELDNRPGKETESGANTGSSGQVRPSGSGNASTGATISTGNGNSMAGGIGTIRNFVETADTESKTVSIKARYEDNIAALETLVILSGSNRLATEEEQAILAKYTGFGGLSEMILDLTKEWEVESNRKYRDYVEHVFRLIDILDPDGSKGFAKTIKDSVKTAYYTPVSVIKGMYEGLQHAGFKGGALLEPSAGVGKFITSMPKSIASNTQVTAIEIDKLTGNILSYLLPKANVQITGFETSNIHNNYDVVISNIPFSNDIHPKDIEFQKQYPETKGMSIHNYFMAKALLSAKPGGIVAAISSTYSMDSELSSFLNKHGQFLGAIRLPSHTFKATSTDVVTDIIYLRRYNKDEQAIGSQGNETLSEVHLAENGREVSHKTNDYWKNNPEHILGKETVISGPFGPKYSVVGDETQDLQKQVSELSKKILPKDHFRNVQDHTNERIKQQSNEWVNESDEESFGNLTLNKDGNIVKIGYSYFIDQKLDEKAAKILGISDIGDTIRKGLLTSVHQKILEDAGIKIEDFFRREAVQNVVAKGNVVQVKKMIELRRLMKYLFKMEMQDQPDAILDNLRKDLREKYEEYVQKYGAVSSKKGNPFNVDADYFLLTSIERKDGDKYVPSDILFKRTIMPRVVPKVETLSDAILVSLDKYGVLDLDYMASLLNKTANDLVQEAQTENAAIFLDPITDAWVERETYLSGNVKEKLRAAQDLPHNKKALEKVIPQDLLVHEIYAPAFARWIPQEVLERFLENIFRARANVNHERLTDKYNVKFGVSNAKVDEYKTSRRSAWWIAENVLNGTEPVVTYVVDKKTYVDEEDTERAKALVKKLASEFEKYVVANESATIEAVYNEKFNHTILRFWDGQHLELPGFNPEIKLHRHQKAGIYRFVRTMGGIADHMVGAGKTYVMIATAMELKRLGKAKKPMIVGLKSQVPQLVESFNMAYPFAKVLSPKASDFDKNKRKQLLSSIATNDWDCIVLTHDQFNVIKQDIEIQMEVFRDAMNELFEIRDAANTKAEQDRLDAAIKKLTEKMDKLNDKKTDDDVLGFHETGVDFLIVDESQQYKNLAYQTRHTAVRGLGSPIGSQRASNMLIAARTIQKNRGKDEGVLFASGTPISNSIAEMYHLFNYLAPTYLEKMGIKSFDQWMAVNTETSTELEYSVGGAFKLVNRIRKFKNARQLFTGYRQIADVRNRTNITIQGKPNIKHELVKIPATSKQLRVNKRLLAFVNSKGKEYRELLGLTKGYKDGKNTAASIMAQTFARKLALHPSLIHPGLGDSPKIKEAANRIKDIYDKYDEEKGTQIVFSDLGTPKASTKAEMLYDYLEASDIGAAELDELYPNHADGKFTEVKTVKSKLMSLLGLTSDEVDEMVRSSLTHEKFNVYTELKNQLVEKGIPPEEIVFIHSYNSDAKKIALYKDVNEGKIRIVLGSTSKLGTGVSIQKKLIAAHHLDIAYRPSDLEQRNGRIERQGNELGLKYGTTAYYYATERSLDALMYDTVRRKADSINSVKTGDLETNEIEEEAEIDLSQWGASLSGNPAFITKANLQKKLKELKFAKDAFRSRIGAAIRNKRAQQDRIERITESLNRNEAVKKEVDAIPKVDIKDKEGKVVSHEREFKAIIEGREYKTIGEAGKAIFNLNQGRMMSSPVGSKFQIGEIYGFKIFGEIISVDNKKYVQRTLLSPSGVVLGGDHTFSNSGEGHGVSQGRAIKTPFDNLDNDIKLQKEAIEKAKEDIKGYEQQEGETIDIDDDILDTEQKLSEADKVIEELQKEEAEHDEEDTDETLFVEESKGYYQRPQFEKNFTTKEGEKIEFTSEKVTYTEDGDLESITWMERQLTQQKHIKLTGPTKIKSPNDVAFLFRHLESASSENAFAVLHKKNGDYQVLYLSTGSTIGTVIPTEFILGAAKQYGASSVTLVHNHPSGNLTASAADQRIHSELKTHLFETGIEVSESVIINLDSGKYTVFSNTDVYQSTPSSPSVTKKVKTFAFDNQLLYTPGSARTKITSSHDVATFLSKYKRGSDTKTGILILDRTNNVNKYILEDGSKSALELVDMIKTEIAFHGNSVILQIGGEFDQNKLNAVKSQLKNARINLLDIVAVKSENGILQKSDSYADSGFLEPPANYAARIRELKIKGGNNLSIKIDFGITQVLFNSALEFMASQIERGTKLGNAIQRTIAYVDQQMNGKSWDRSGFAKMLGKEKNKTKSEIAEGSGVGGEPRNVFEFIENSGYERDNEANDVRYKKDGVTIGLSPNKLNPFNKGSEMIPKDEKGFTINIIATDPSVRGKGEASKALKEITDYADKNGETIYLSANDATIGFKKGLNKKQLEDWYSRHGFEKDESIMVRKPTQSKATVKTKEEGSGAGDVELQEKQKEIKGYDKLKEVEKNGGYIKTDETIIDNDYEPTDVEHKRTKAYKVEYNVKWSDNETSSNPDIETFSTIDEAHKAAQTEGDWWNGGIDHLKRIEPVYKEVWLNKDGTEFEETGKTLNGDEFSETKEGKGFIKDFRFSKYENSSEVYVKDFGKRDDNSRELETETYLNLGSDLETTFKADNGETYAIKHSGRGKYSSLKILDKEGDEIDRVQLRIADHTYNPRNNDDAARSGKFISVEIANVNATKGKFNTSYSLQFDGTDTYKNVLETVKERLNEILENKIEYPGLPLFSPEQEENYWNATPLSRRPKDLYDGLQLLAAGQDRWSGLAKEILSSSSREELEAIKIFPTRAGRSFYQRGNIYLNKKQETNPYVVFREIIHGLTSNKIPWYLRNNKSGKKYLEQLNKALGDPNVSEGIKDLITLYIDTVEVMGLTDTMFKGVPVEHIVKPRVHNVTIDEISKEPVKMQVSFPAEHKAAVVKHYEERGHEITNLHQRNGFTIMDVYFHGEERLTSSTIIYDKKQKGVAGDADAAQQKIKMYGLGNLDEFLAEGLSNPLFQKKLINIKSNRTKTNKSAQLSLFDRFVSAIKKALGISPQGTVLGDLLQVFDKIRFEKPYKRPTAQQVQFEGSQIVFSPTTPDPVGDFVNNMILKHFILKGKSVRDAVDYFANNPKLQGLNRDIKAMAEDIKRLYEQVEANKFSEADVTAILEDVENDKVKQGLFDYASAYYEQPQQQQQNQNQQQKSQSQQNQQEDIFKGFRLTSGDTISQLQSGKTIESVFGQTPSGDQNYNEVALSHMLQDGDTMISMAQNHFGSTSVYDYALPLLNFIKSGAMDSGPRAIILGRLLFEIKKEKERADTPEVRTLDRMVEKYYQEYMRHTSLELNAGRLLRILRDNDASGIFSDPIVPKDVKPSKKVIDDALTENDITDDITETTDTTPDLTESQEASQTDQTEDEEPVVEKKSKKRKEYQDKAAQLASKFGDILKDTINFLNKPKC